MVAPISLSDLMEFGDLYCDSSTGKFVIYNFEEDELGTFSDVYEVLEYFEKSYYDQLHDYLEEIYDVTIPYDNDFSSLLSVVRHYGDEHNLAPIISAFIFPESIFPS